MYIIKQMKSNTNNRLKYIGTFKRLISRIKLCYQFKLKGFFNNRM